MDETIASGNFKLQVFPCTEASTSDEPVNALQETQCDPVGQSIVAQQLMEVSHSLQSA